MRSRRSWLWGPAETLDTLNVATTTARAVNVFESQRSGIVFIGFLPAPSMREPSPRSVPEGDVTLVGRRSVIVGPCQAVAVAAHGVDPARPPWVVAHGPPKRHHVVVYLPQRGFGLEAAHLLDDVRARHDLAAALGQDLEDEDVVRREVESALGRGGGYAAEIEANAPHADLARPFR